MKIQGITELGADSSSVDMRGRYKQLSTYQMKNVLGAAADLRRLPPKQILRAIGMNPSAIDANAAEVEHLPAPYGAGTLHAIGENANLGVALLRNKADPDMTPLFDSCDETKRWQKNDVDRVGGKLMIIGMCFDFNKEKDETFLDLNTECDVTKAAPNVFATNLKRIDYWDVATISALSFWHNACNKKFVTKHMLNVRESIGNIPDAYSIASGVDCHSSFAECAKIALGLKPIPDAPYAAEHMVHLPPFLNNWEYGALVIKHQKSGLWFFHMATVDQYHLDKRLVWALRAKRCISCGKLAAMRPEH